MKQLSITALIHPTMISKIRLGMVYAHKGEGHKMNGHGKRVYITNAKGRNIMRLDWVGGKQGYIVYGNESVNITRTVRNALASVVVREMVKPVADGYKVEHTTQYNKEQKPVGLKQRTVAKAFKYGTISTLGILLSGCSLVQGWLV